MKELILTKWKHKTTKAMIFMYKIPLETPFSSGDTFWSQVSVWFRKNAELLISCSTSDVNIPKLGQNQSVKGHPDFLTQLIPFFLALSLITLIWFSKNSKIYHAYDTQKYLHTSFK